MFRSNAIYLLRNNLVLQIALKDELKLKRRRKKGKYNRMHLLRQSSERNENVTSIIHKVLILDLNM